MPSSSWISGCQKCPKVPSDIGNAHMRFLLSESCNPCPSWPKSPSPLASGHCDEVLGEVCSMFVPGYERNPNFHICTLNIR